MAKHICGLFTQYINSGFVCKTLLLVGNPLHAWTIAMQMGPKHRLPCIHIFTQHHQHSPF